MNKLNKFSIVRFVSEYLLTVALITVTFNFFTIFPGPVKRGFFCNDESLKYPYRSDSVSATALLILSFYGPIALMAIGESLLFLLERWRTTNVQDHGLGRAFLRLHYNLTVFICGFAMHAFFVQAAKLVLGRLRPHFFDVCQPYRRIDGSTCDNPRNHGIYIEDYECNNNNISNSYEDMLIHLHSSFPSGHSSFIFYGMTFIILYLQRFSQVLGQQRIHVGLFMMIVQMFCALLAWLVAVSRVMDNKHHWSDVLVGIVLGTSAAIAVTLYLCQQLKSVNSYPEGVKSSKSETTSTMKFTTTSPNNILVP